MQDALLGLEVFPHRLKCLYHALDSLAKLQAGEIGEQLLHLALPPLPVLTRHGGRHQPLPQRHRQRHGKRGVAHPNAIEPAKALHLRRQDVGDEHGQVGSGRALVLLKLCRPVLAPILRALRLPQDAAAIVTGVGAHTLEHVGAALALRYGLDAVQGELRREAGFQIQLEHFTLELHRALFGLLLEVLDFALEVTDDLLFFGQFEALSFDRRPLHFFTELATFGVQFTGDFQIERLALVFELALLLPQCEFRGLGLLELSIALAYLGAEVLHLDGKLVLDLPLRLRQDLCFAGFDFGAHLLFNSLPGPLKSLPLVCQRLLSGDQARLLRAALLIKVARELFADAM